MIVILETNVIPFTKYRSKYHVIIRKLEEWRRNNIIYIIDKKHKENGTKNRALRNTRSNWTPISDCTLNTTRCFCCERKSWIHWRRKPLMPIKWSFVSNRLWSTLSNAELKSKKIPSTKLHLWSSRALQSRWKNLTNICSQFLPLQKPNWLSDKIPCSSTYFMIRIEINFSITLHKILVSETGQ